jgi:uncharacterized LabA/DUF88 family protein
MTAQFARAAHIAGRGATPVHNAPHAALLIDFDNVTMGIRSDLTKELKNLLNSDIIKGKVAVQRAYADWRRYPQYIVPLAENSVDLIFAPAYGTSKKNATDIRLSIDALELVFTRPEIGTFILLSGDSDFSSLVLKLKEYGKYVIGVGIRESASDLLVQNCDEYYSYSALTGLTRTGEEEVTPLDPWECAEIAVQRMAENDDVMRSDRLKQVMLELDPNFDEKALGFTKFNRFLQEAATRGVLTLRKLENGQFEVGPSNGEPMAPAAETVPPPAEEPPRDSRRARRSRDRERGREWAAAAEQAAPIEPSAAPEPVPEVLPSVNGLSAAYELLRRATRDVTQGKGAARDSDVKRRILELQPAWTEASVGFSKFSRFLRQAHDAEVINLRKLENGNYELTLPGEPEPAPERRDRKPTRDRGRDRDRDRKGGRRERPSAAALAPEAATAQTVTQLKATTTPTPPAPSALYHRRRGRTPATAPPPLLEGQTIGPVKSTPRSDAPLDAVDAIKRLTALKGVGQKTAEAALQAFGPGVLDVVKNDPERVRQELGARRAQPLLDALGADAPTRSARKGGRKGAGKRTRSKSAPRK